MAAVDKLKVRLDAAQILPIPPDVIVRDDIRVVDTFAQAITNNIWLEPYSGAIMALPLQFSDDFYLNSTVTRYGISSWTLDDGSTPITTHWDEREREYDRWVVSDGTTELIQTSSDIDADTGLFLSVFLCGEEDDTFEALRVWFGQWKLVIYSNGKADVYVVKDGVDYKRGTGWLNAASRNTLCNRISNLMIVPTADQRLLVRRNGVAGFTTIVPDEDLGGAGDDEIITAAKVKLQAPGSSMIRFQLTELAYDTSTDCEYVSPVRALGTPPTDGATITATVDQLNLGGLIACNVYEGYDPADPPTGIGDLTPFSAGDGIVDSYCIGVLINPTATCSPIFRGATVMIDPPEGTEPEDPADITADVTSCVIEPGENPVNTEAKLTIRDVDDHPILGVCNRWCDVMIGDVVVLRGVLREPPALIYRDGYRSYEITVQSIAKFLDQPCLHSNVRFDGVAHTTAVEWLLRFAGIGATEFEIQTDTTTLPNTASQPDGSDSKLRPGIADTPMEWITRVAEMTGWEFRDGVLEAVAPATIGNYGFVYLDPLARNETSAHTFVFHTSNSAGDDAYDIIHSEARWYAQEPESNEVWVVGCNEKGERIAAVYRDEDSQDATLTEELRPDNWLGYRKVGLIPVKRVVTMDMLKAIALRIGTEVSQRVDLVDFEADWKPGLWRGVYVTLDTNEDDDLPTIEPLWRIERISSITFDDEGSDYPSRRARYTCVASPRHYYVPGRDEQMMRWIRDWITAGGGTSDIRGPVGGTSPAQDLSGALPGTGPITAIEFVTVTP